MKHFSYIIILLITIKAGAQFSALAVADSLYAVGDYTKAIQAYTNNQQLDANTTLQLARSYKGLGLRTTALDFYKQSLVLNPSQPIAATEYGRLLITTSKFNEADSLFGNLASQFPNNAGYQYQWGRAIKELEKSKDSVTMLYVGKRVDEMGGARGAFAKAVSLDSTHQKAIYELSLQFLKEKEYTRVENLTAHGMENDSLDIEIINLRAQNAFARGYKDEALTWFERLAALGVSNEFLHRRLGNCYESQGFVELSRDNYEQVLTYDDQDAAVHLILARLNNRMKVYDKAKLHAEAALLLRDNPLDDIYLTLGRMYELHKKYPEAIDALQKALKENPDNLQALHGIAISADNYYEDKKEVLKLYERAQEKATALPKGKYFLYLIEPRIKELKQEIFIAGQMED